MARRDDGEYREYLTEEQRSQRGCIARRMQPDFHHGLLGSAELVELDLQQPAALSRPNQHKGEDRQDTGGERQRHAQSWSAGRPHARE